jgi:hypothetical protein
VWIGGFIVKGFSMTPVSVSSNDGGVSWTKKQLPQNALFTIFQFKDPDHVYAAGDYADIYKCGDPNEQWVYEPDEAPDADTEPSNDDTEPSNDDTVDETAAVDDGTPTGEATTPDEADSGDELLDADGEELWGEESGCGCALVY